MTNFCFDFVSFERFYVLNVRILVIMPYLNFTSALQQAPSPSPRLLQLRHPDAVFLPLNPHLLERYDLARLDVPRRVHDAVLPFNNVVQLPKFRREKTLPELILLLYNLLPLLS